MSMDWQLAIERNRADLLGIVTQLFALIGLVEGGRIPFVPNHLRFHVLRILRPAEAALRRLIIVAARSLTVTLSERDLRGAARKPQPDAKGPTVVSSGPVNLGLASAVRPQPEEEKPERAERPLSAPPFQLIDPLKRFDVEPRRKFVKNPPRIRSLSDWSVPVYMRLPEPEPKPDKEPDARAICRRLLSLKHALENIEAEAMRLARWTALRKAGLQRVPRLSPMRPGWPPGHRKKPRYAIDEVLAECNWLAGYSRNSS